MIFNKSVKRIRCVVSMALLLLLTGLAPSRIYAEEPAEQAEPSTSIELEVKAVLAEDSEQPEEALAFTFVLEAEAESNPMPADNTATVAGEDNTAAFGEMTFTKPGLYTYTIRQQNDGAEGVTYDDSVYHVRITARWSQIRNNTLLVLVEAYHNDDTEKAPELEFINDYEEPEEPKEPEESEEPKEPEESEVPQEPEEPEQPEESEPGPVPEDPSVPDTGDTTNVAFWIAVELLSALIVIGLCVLGKKQQGQN